MTRTTLFMPVLLLAAAAMAGAQLPPGLPIPYENFATLHPFGSSGVVALRHMALGGAHVADERYGWHGNPAGMVSTTDYTVEAHSTWAPFKMIPDVHRTALGACAPVGKGIVKLVYVRATAAGGVHGFAAPVTVDGRETDISGEYAQRVSPRLAIGVGTAVLSTRQTYTVPGLGVVTHMKSNPGTLGGRIGAIYKLTDKVSAGATYDNYIERVSRSAPAFGIPSSMESFHSTGWHVGVAYWPDEKTTVLFDRQDINVVGAGANLYRGAWHGGVERTEGAWAFRLGAYADRLTGGIGWRGGRWDVSWAFSGKPDKDVPGMGAGVSHGLRVAATL